MKIRAPQLEQYLSKQQAPLILVFGEEPLLIIESADLILKSARANGITEHEIIHIESVSDWSDFEMATTHYSLFSSQKILDVRLHTEKLGDKGSKILLHYAENPNPDITVLLRAAKLDASQQKARWFRAIDSHGLIVQVWPLRGEALSKWLQQKARELKLYFSLDAMTFFQQQTEGHLLAAKQELDRLAITHADSKIEIETLRSALLDHARFDVFDLIEPILDKNAAEALRRLGRLKDEGLEVAIILWAIAREVRAMGRMAFEVQSGQPVDLVLQNHYVWATHRQRIARWLKDTQADLWPQLTCLCQQTDAALKGMRDQITPWQAMDNLIVAFATKKNIL